MATELSLIKPDFTSIREMLEQTLENYPAWKDTLPTGTGRTLTDWIAAVGANDQYAIEHAFRESFRTARLDSSIIAQAIMLGVRLSRKLPCSTTVVLSKSTPGVLTIPALSQFTSNSAMLFNREAITLSGATPVTVQLHEGSIVTKTLEGTGANYQIYSSVDADYRVSDSDVEVRLNNVVLPRITKGLWTIRQEEGWNDSTSPTGQLVITFGGTFGATMFGSKPGTTDTVQIKYVLTQGTAGSNANFSDEVTSVDFVDVHGTVSGGLTGGADEKDVIFYRRLNPQLFSARGGATTQDEYSAVAASYPSVLDAICLGQRMIAPNDLRWMNLVQVSLLTETPMSAAQWTTFEDWFTARTMYPVRLYRRDPVALPTDIVANIYCQARAELETVKAAGLKQLQALFAPRPGIIDATIYLSDIHAMLRTADNAVEFVELVTPTTNIVSYSVSPAIKNIEEVSGGTLPKGFYKYSITAILPQGETRLASHRHASVTGNAKSLRITWEAINGALEYRVYGRDAVNFGLLSVVPGNSNSYVDTGAATPDQDKKPDSAVQHFYPALGEVTLNVYYTSRNFYNLGNLK